MTRLKRVRITFIPLVAFIFVLQALPSSAQVQTEDSVPETPAVDTVDSPKASAETNDETSIPVPTEPAELVVPADSAKTEDNSETVSASAQVTTKVKSDVFVASPPTKAENFADTNDASAEGANDTNTSNSNSPKRWITVNALMQSIFLMQNDSDFDPTRPEYDKNGQTVGAFATLFKPSITFNIEDFGQLFYDLELGLNVWSKNNPDQADPTADDRFFLKHRELWASGQFFDDMLAFKVGYQHFADPSGLFLNHWMGVASVGINLGQSEHIWLSFGQVPDATYEGFVMTENNFSHDTFFFGLHRLNPIGKIFKLKTSVFALMDSHVVGRNRMIVAPTLGAEIAIGPALASLDATMQFGRSDYGVNGVDTKHVAWAIEAHGDLELGPIGIALNALFLSPDDEHDRNDFDGAFLYSGKNRSATVILTEDEFRDRGDNLDERLGTRDGGFYQLRSGLAVADLKIEGRIGDFFRPAIIAGAGFVLSSENAGDSSYAGTELDIDFGFIWKDVFAWHILGGLFIPGEAGAMLINELNRARTEMQFTVLSSLSVKY